MLFEGWMANVSNEDMSVPLKKFGATNIEILKGQDGPESKWLSYCDTDDDIIDILKIMLWYNDRSDADIEAIGEAMKQQLLERKRMVNAP